MELELEGGGSALVYRRRPNCYPAEMFAPLASEHLAWVISRMENICCALAFSGIQHGDIRPESVWINPLLHEGALFGDWRALRPLRDRSDLAALRKTAIRLAKNQPVEAIPPFTGTLVLRDSVTTGPYFTQMSSKASSS